MLAATTLYRVAVHQLFGAVLGFYVNLAGEIDAIWIWPSLVAMRKPKSPLSKKILCSITMFALN